VGRQPHQQRRLEEGAQVVAETRADERGRAEFTFTVPDDLGGTHGLWVDMGGERKKTGTFWIKPTALPLDVWRGPAGTEFRIHLKGTGWTETSNIMHVVYDNAYIGYACGFNSQGDIEVILKATGEPAGTSSISIPASTRARRRGRTISASRSSPGTTTTRARTIRRSASRSR